jgi:hypothetical protein
MEANPIDNLRFDVDGRAYFLHHSRAEIKVGETIKTTGAFAQSTAGDSLYGHSYGWDAMNPRAISDAFYNDPKTGNHAKNIYITSADAEQVMPDLNVIQSNARAISDEQTILQRISLAADETFESAHARVTAALQGLNIPMRTVEEERLANLEMAISERGQRASAGYMEASAETKMRELAKLMDSGKSVPHRVPDNLDEMSKLADQDYNYNYIENGRPNSRNLQAPLQGRAYREGGLDGLRAEITKQHGTFDAFGRRGEVIGQLEELTARAGDAAGRKLGTLSKGTLRNILKAGEVAAAVMRKKSGAATAINLLGEMI